MTPTDDERRRVAERLRMSDERDAAGFVDCLLAEVVRGREFCETPCEECHARLLGELADLIEPSDHIGDSDKMVDRKALLALADKMSRYASLRKSHGMDVDTMAVMAWVHRIREACGEVDG